MPRVAIHQLGTALDDSGWAESAAESGFSQNWDRELFGIEIPPWRWSVVQLAEAAYHAFGGRRIVVGDMGCGAATYARHLLTTGISFEYHGYDHNLGVLEAAQQRLEWLPCERIELRQLDARSAQWPIEDQKFDVLIWDSTLRFCDRPEQAILESFRTTRGWIILARTPLEEKTWREKVRYYGMRQPSANWHFSADRLGELARAAGWHLTPSLGDAETQVFSRTPLPSTLTIQPTRNTARMFHSAYVRERVARLFESRAGQWAIYGAGAHSHWLTSILDRRHVARIAYFLDDRGADSVSESEKLAGIPVLKPQSSRPRDVAGVLVSSDTIEEKLIAAARRWIGEQGVVERLYEGFPNGPFDKAVPLSGFRSNSN